MSLRSLQTPPGMTRRHLLTHLATGAGILPGLEFLSHLDAHAAEVRKRQKACILLWMSGGPPTIDIWDLKPGSKNGGEFKPISTSAPGVQISEQLPETAKVMRNLAIVRSMSTREADHTRGRYYMHTAFVPVQTVVHPTFGSVVSYELGTKRQGLELPAFVSIGGPSMGPGFLGMTHAPFVVGNNGEIKNASLGKDVDAPRLKQRLDMLASVETNFIRSNRGQLPSDHQEVYGKAVYLMTSQQLTAFKVDQESPETIALYCGTNAPAGGGGRMGGGRQNQFGMGCLMARRLVEAGVPFVEVDLGGWDMHRGVFDSLKQRMPMVDQALSGLVTDLDQRGMLNDTTIVWMGEFGRTPRINADTGRDHWARSWSVVMGGGGLKVGQAVGATNDDGTECTTQTYLPGDIWATVAHALGIPLDTIHWSKRGQQMKLANGGTPIKELIG